jgi:hypothetical protein
MYEKLITFSGLDRDLARQLKFSPGTRINVMNWPKAYCPKMIHFVLLGAFNCDSIGLFSSLAHFTVLLYYPCHCGRDVFGMVTLA